MILAIALLLGSAVVICLSWKYFVNSIDVAQCALNIGCHVT